MQQKTFLFVEVFFKMVPPMGLEPMTHALKVRYSTTELRRIKSKNGDIVY